MLCHLCTDFEFPLKLWPLNWVKRTIDQGSEVASLQTKSLKGGRKQEDNESLGEDKSFLFLSIFPCFGHTSVPVKLTAR